MRKSELSNVILQFYTPYVKNHVYLLKYERNYERIKGAFEGFISGLYYANRIDTRNFRLMRIYNRSVVKSIIRHYKKIKE